MTDISRRDFVALTAAGAAATPFLLDDPWARAAAGVTAQEIVDRVKKSVGVDWRRDERRFVQSRRSVNGRHRRGDDLDGDARRPAEGRPGRRQFHHHRGADLLFEGGPERARGTGRRPWRCGTRRSASWRRFRRGAAAVAGDGQRPRHRRLGGDAAGPGAATIRRPAGDRRPPLALRPRLRRRTRSMPARTPSSRSTSWSCSG